jgi:hypothetical protein
MPAPLDAVREIACTLSAKKWPTEQVERSEESMHFLRFAPGERPFAQVVGGDDASLAIPVGLSTAGARLRIDANGVVVEGNMEAAELPLYPATAFVLSGFFVPDAQRRLGWRSASPGTMTIAGDGGPRVRPVRGEISGARPCAEISLGAVALPNGAIEAAMHATSAPADVNARALWLKPGRAWLYPHANDEEPVAFVDAFDPPDDTLLVHPVHVLTSQKAWTRIAMDAFGGTVFGWVQSDRLGPSTKQYIDLQHDAFSILVPAPPTPGTYETCEHDLPLVAAVAGESRLVGTVRARTGFKRERVDGEWTVLAFEQTKVLAAEGASFRARTTDLQTCRRE